MRIENVLLDALCSTYKSMLLLAVGSGLVANEVNMVE